MFSKKSIDKFTKAYEKICYVKFDDLVYNKKRAINKLISSLGVPLKDSKLSKKELEDFIKPKLKNHNISYIAYLPSLISCLIPQIYFFRRSRSKRKLLVIHKTMFSLSAKLKKRSKSYSNFIKFIKGKNLK